MDISIGTMIGGLAIGVVPIFANVSIFRSKLCVGMAIICTVFVGAASKLQAMGLEEMNSMLISKGQTVIFSAIDLKLASTLTDWIYPTFLACILGRYFQVKHREIENSTE